MMAVPCVVFYDGFSSTINELSMIRDFALTQKPYHRNYNL